MSDAERILRELDEGTRVRVELHNGVSVTGEFGGIDEAGRAVIRSRVIDHRFELGEIDRVIPA